MCARCVFLSILVIAYSSAIYAQETMPTDAMTSTATIDTTVNPLQPCYWGSEKYSSGQQIDYGTFWYECVDGKLTPRGCFSDRRERLNFSESYVMDNGYEMTCQLTSNSTYRIYPSACVNEGKRYIPGETFQDEFFWYTCQLQGNMIRKQPSGCVDNNSNRINPGDILTQGSFLFLCNLDKTGSYQLLPIACMNKKKRYDVGADMVDGIFWYKCVRKTNNYVTFQLEGCVYAGKKLTEGEGYIRTGFLFQCQKRQGGSMAHAIVGCVDEQTTGQNGGPGITRHAFDTTWTTGKAPYLFLMRCEKTDSGGAIQRLISCVYDTANGKMVVEPGCMKRTGLDLIMCYKRPDGGLAVDKTNTENAQSGLDRGLTECL